MILTFASSLFDTTCFHKTMESSKRLTDGSYNRRTSESLQTLSMDTYLREYLVKGADGCKENDCVD